MKKVLLIFFTSVFFTGAYAQDAQDTAWTVKGDAGLMFSQTSFTNWAAGGENSVTINGLFNYYAGYEKGNKKWENFIALAYGQTKVGEGDFRKSEDKIDLQSIYGLKAADKWFYTANFSFRSQFAEGYNYNDGDPDLDKVKISNFLAPAFISMGLGMEYKPTDYLSFYLSPATARLIVVNDQDLADAGAFGVEPAAMINDSTIDVGTGETTKFEVGAHFRFLFSKDIMKNVSFNTKLELFSDYLSEPQNIDVNWDTQIGMKVNDWISANFGLTLLYDHDTPVMDADGMIGPRTQIKQLLSAGITYKFANK